MTSTINYWDNIERVKEAINVADAVLVGIGAGMSTSAGLSYSGERFHKYFDDFHKKYGITDMYSGGFYSFESIEEYWAWWSRHIYYNRYDISAGEPYIWLMELLQNKNYLNCNMKLTSIQIYNFINFFKKDIQRGSII